MGLGGILMSIHAIMFSGRLTTFNYLIYVHLFTYVIHLFYELPTNINSVVTVVIKQGVP